MKRAALYLRVSTLDQHPETQLYDLRQMAEQRGYQIVQQFEDRISGAKARRPGLDALMRDARRSQFDVVLVWASDRIARSVKHFLEVLDEFNRLNIEFISFREQIDTAGPLGRAVVVIIGAIAGLRAQPKHPAGSGWNAAGQIRGPTYRTQAACSRSRCHPAGPPARPQSGPTGEIPRMRPLRVSPPVDIEQPIDPSGRY